MNTSNMKPKQRWHYKDTCQNLILEIINPTNSYSNVSENWDCRVVQVILVYGRPLNDVNSWTTNYGTWTYLEGQDAI